MPDKDDTLKETLAAALALWPQAPFGVFVGRDGDRVFVGFITGKKGALRFCGDSYTAALQLARAWDEHHSTWRDIHMEVPGTPQAGRQ